MVSPKFTPDEMKVVREMPSFGGPPIKVYNTPVSLEEGYTAAMRRKPLWVISGMGVEASIFNPRINRDNLARAFCFDGEGMVMNDQAGVPVGGPDIFGVEWVFVPAAGGSMVKPGAPLLQDVNDWKSVVRFPDLDSWDWAASEEKNAAYLKSIRDGGVAVQGMILNGYFERLISFMDFEGAALAMVDEDQQDAVKELMMALADLYIKMIDRYHKHYGIIHYNIHDDWGSQMAPFFSPAVGRELIVPAMRKVNDHIHDVLGGTVEFHCCGHVDLCIPNMIEAHWDSWSGMPMNDSQGDWEQYGDKICIGVIPDQYDPATASEEQQRQEARKFVDKFCKPGRSAVLNAMYAGPLVTPAFREELYRYSRIKLCGE